MMKIVAIISLVFIVGSVWADCDSCGRECTSSCGTRRFRACCFNYLRKKRGSDDVQDNHVNGIELRFPIYIESIPKPDRLMSIVLPKENEAYSLNNKVEYEY